MEFRVLGPLEVEAHGQVIPVSSPRLKALLAVLLMRANKVVGFAELVEAVWGARTPENPRPAIYTLVTRLRRLLRDVAIEAGGDGYRITVDEGQVDIKRFETAIVEARTAGNREAEVLRQALALWRGEPFADVESDYLRRITQPLAERRLQVLERKFELDITEGATPRRTRRSAGVGGRPSDARATLGVVDATVALERYQANGYKTYEALASVAIGRVHLSTGRLTDALEYMRRGQRLAREGAATSAEIEALTGMAWTGHDSEHAVEALNLARKHGLRLLEAKALTALADTKLRRGEVEEASRIAEQALAMHREFGCVPGEREALAVVSRVKEN